MIKIYSLVEIIILKKINQAGVLKVKERFKGKIRNGLQKDSCIFLQLSDGRLETDTITHIEETGPGAYLITTENDLIYLEKLD